MNDGFGVMRCIATKGQLQLHAHAASAKTQNPMSALSRVSPVHAASRESRIIPDRPLVQVATAAGEPILPNAAHRNDGRYEQA
jgi:hypothetical protein